MWVWLLIGWAVAATVVALVLAAAAGKARGRERAARAHQYAGELAQEQRAS